jgi:hypothetical protein
MMLRRKFLKLLLMSTAPFIMGIPTVASASGGGSGPGDNDGVAGGSSPGDNDGVAGGSGYSGGISGSSAGDVSSQNGIVNDVESALDSDGMEAVDADDVASALAEFN